MPNPIANVAPTHVTVAVYPASFLARPCADRQSHHFHFSPMAMAAIFILAISVLSLAIDHLPTTTVSTQFPAPSADTVPFSCSASLSQLLTHPAQAAYACPQTIARGLVLFQTRPYRVQLELELVALCSSIREGGTKW
ncbi:hypothetical protein C8035_v011482 [Colletotrichum spinosum]|uniref:Uncharacterized protein n=1 Tax=Colletotrichum spinosum TaxID=1347390 RepID=A0A4R8Q8U5_9PEZI|nr:hypothetical protein C8035_v011482 [Colletotrichum spinosum]